MNKLDIKTRAQIIGLLVEGSSMRSITRLVGCSINTVTKLLIDVGTACNQYQYETIHGLNCKRIQCDEIWAFCGMKERNVPDERKGEYGYGDVYTWTALDADTKLIVSYLVGKRDVDYAKMFIGDLRNRVNGRIQLTTDGHSAYLTAIEKEFGFDADYAMLVKQYGLPQDMTGHRRYSPSRFVGSEKTVISGNPDMTKVSTSFVERQNLTMRMSMRRFTRLTNAFSKKVENLEHAVALHFMYYNFGRIHKTLRVTPAMEASISDHVWSLEEIAGLVPEPIAKKRGSYKKR
jgi:IS1 family transposase